MASVLAALVPCAVMLVPGAFGNGTSSRFLNAADYFAEYVSYFESHGCRVKKAAFPSDATLEVRALMLRDQTLRFALPEEHSPERHPEERLWLVAHSQGALDARYALKSLQLSGVSALVAIGAPQAGTPLADWVVREREREGFWYELLKFFGGYDLKGLSFAAEMTPEFLRNHSAQFEKVESVRYASARGICRTACHISLKVLDWITGAPEVGAGKGDGIVSGESQAWGEDLGEYDLDHISEVGTDALRYKERRKFLDRVWDYLSRDKNANVTR